MENGWVIAGAASMAQRFQAGGRDPRVEVRVEHPRP